MRPPLASSVVLLLTLASCAGGGTPAPAPASAGASSQAAAPAAAKGGRRLALLEVSGAKVDTDRFVSAFLLELSERGHGGIADARLSGASLSDLTVGAGRDDLVRTWPADVYVAVDIQPCHAQTQTIVSRERRDVSVAGSVVENAVVDVPVTRIHTTCDVTLRLADRNGKALPSVSIAGESSASPDADVDGAESSAAEDAAKRAAKKLVSIVR